MASRRGGTEGETTRPRVFPAWLLLGMALCAPTYGFYLSATGSAHGEPNPYFQVASLGAFLPPLALIAMQARLQPAIVAATGLIIAGFALPPTLSIVLHIPDYEFLEMMVAFTRIAAVILYMITMGMILQHPRYDDLLAGSFGTMAVLLAGLFVFSALTDPVWVWGRFKPSDMHPNWWGEVLLAATFGASFVRPALVRYGIWAVALIGLALVQSRGSLLCTLIVMAFAVLKLEGRARLMRFGLLALVVGLPCLLVVDGLLSTKPLLISAYEYVVNDVLKINDPGRGLGSGLSGRDENWAKGFAVFAQSPLIGIGFSRTDMIVDDALGTSVHNGLLTLASDVGLPMVLLLFGLMYGALWRSLSARRWREGGYLLAFLIVYMMISPRSINMSVLPMLLWMLVVQSWALPVGKENANPAEIAPGGTPRYLASRWPARQGIAPPRPRPATLR